MDEIDQSQNNVNNLNQEGLLPNINIEMPQRQQPQQQQQQQNPRRPLFVPYGSSDAPFPNQVYPNQVFDTAMNVEMHYQEILTTLNRIADNREINMVSFSIILIVALFLGYMAIDFGLNEDLLLEYQGIYL